MGNQIKWKRITELGTFYTNLYSKNRNQVTIEVENKFLNNKDMPRLSDEDGNLCEGQLTD